jgi:hypothetical protein
MAVQNQNRVCCLASKQETERNSISVTICNLFKVYLMFPKRRQMSTSLYDLTFRETVFFIFTTKVTSHFANCRKSVVLPSGKEDLYPLVLKY